MEDGTLAKKRRKKSKRCHDKIRGPGAIKKRQLLREMMGNKLMSSSVVGDFRRSTGASINNAKNEPRYIGCQIDEKEERFLDSQTVSPELLLRGYAAGPSSIWTWIFMELAKE